MYALILWTEDQVKSWNPKQPPVCLGIALIGSDVPTAMVGRYGLARRLHVRGGVQPEYRFLYRDHRPRLPVIRDGQLVFPRWGNGRGQSRFLPRSGWTWLASVREGMWQNAGGIAVDIPATYGLETRGSWFKIQVGIRGLLVPDERGAAVVYMLCEPASHYYNIMNGNDRMPVLINQRI